MSPAGNTFPERTSSKAITADFQGMSLKKPKSPYGQQVLATEPVLSQTQRSNDFGSFGMQSPKHTQQQEQSKMYGSRV